MAGGMFQVPAESYDRFMGRYSGSLAAEFAAFAGVEPGMRVLDVGCGPGALSAALVELVRAGNVVGVDPSEPFAEACRARLGIEVETADAERLPFPDGGFDAALAQLVVNFMQDAQAGVREMARVTRPGGIVAACLWDYGGGMQMLRMFWDAAVELDPERGGRADEAGMRYMREGELAALWRAAGLGDVRDGAIHATASYADFDDLWEPFTLGVGPAGAFVASLDAESRARLREALRARVDADGPFELSAKAWAVSGRSRAATPL
jgi:SAM-dependent methyltransferase